MSPGARPKLPQSMRASGFTDPAFTRLADLAHLLAGLAFPPNRQPSAEAGMRRAMAALRISDPDALLRAVEAPGAARDVVLAELTVGESYFFRDAAQLALLGTEILPARVESYGESRPLRVWSAGCASGEEPYTIAIMLRELSWPHPARIVGSDVAIARLQAARRGRYTRWALRGVSDDRVARWFQRHGNYFDVDSSVRRAVEFRTVNLVDEDITSAERGAGGHDLVLCRNVMIYFDLPTVARIAARLLESLAEDGWLVLGSSDPPLADLIPCETVVTKTGGIAYRRAGRAGATVRREWYSLGAAPAQLQRIETPAPDPITVPVGIVMEARQVAAPEPVPRLAASGRDEILRAYQHADYPAVESMALVLLAAASEDPEDVEAPAIWVLCIRAIANQGRLHDAGELCARALERYPLAAELHCLHATLLAEAGWHADAAIAARRSIYLDRKLVMGHLLLGDALTRTGDESGARIAFENVVALLADADPSAPVAAADGVLASRLRQIATLRLRDVSAMAGS